MIELLVVVLTSTAMLGQIAYFLPRVVDDLFISLRYAENLVRGFGLVYNPGERVEGFSSPLWLVLQAMGLAAGVEGVTWTKLLGIGSLLALQAAVYHFGREVIGLHKTIALFVCLFLALNSYVLLWGLLGLETPAFLALLLGTALFLRRWLDAQDARTALWSRLAAICFVLVRPEAPLFLLAMAGGEILSHPRDRQSCLRRGALVLRWSAAPVATFASVFVARRLYYGLWLPHTYYAKEGHAFDLGHALALVGEGASLTEAVFWLGGGTLLAVMAMRRGSLVPLAITAACITVAASVQADWMPSLRHLLPVLLMAPFGWAWLADALWRARWPYHAGRVGALVLAAMIVVTGSAMGSIDCRLSRREFDIRRNDWIRKKTSESWQNALHALKRTEPPDVAAMSVLEMGMITQNFRILEASSDPVEQSWYVGRDIGKVGYYTGVRVFDTDGLFTPSVVESRAWRKRRAVEPTLLEQAFRGHPIAAELLDDWTSVAAAHPWMLAGYDGVAQAADDPRALVARVRRPAPAEVLARYERSLAKFPKLFYMQTLYGEGVSAAMNKRFQFVRRAIEDHAEPFVASAPNGVGGAGALLDGSDIEAKGCTAAPARVAPGQALTVDCYFRANRAVDRRLAIFFHFENERGPGRFLGDHPPLGGIVEWPPNRLVRDVAHVEVPSDVPEGDYRLFFGVFRGDVRAKARPVEMTDGKDRILGPIVAIRRPLEPPGREPAGEAPTAASPP